jgi:hypothetical protein
LRNVPHLEEDAPAVCAWYPTAGKVLVWNLAPEPRDLTLKDGERRVSLHCGPLEAVAAEVTVRPEA